MKTIIVNIAKNKNSFLPVVEWLKDSHDRLSNNKPVKTLLALKTECTVQASTTIRLL